MTEASTSSRARELLDELFSPAGMANRYSRYRALHDAGTLVEIGPDSFVVWGFDAVQTVLRDASFGRSPYPAPPGVSADDYAGIDLFVNHPGALVSLNPPEHTRMRRLISKAFTPTMVESLRARIDAIVDGLLRRLPVGEDVDIVDALALPLPVTVIGELLGVPEPDRMSFEPLVVEILLALQPAPTWDDLVRASAASTRMMAYFATLAEERRARPTDDLFSALLQVDVDGDNLADDDIIALGVELMTAGFETTRNLVGNGLHALLRHPDQLRRLRENPDGIPQAVEEMLRWDAPVHRNSRVSRRGTVLDGTELPAGTRVAVLLGAANWDPRRFTEPHLFDIARDEGPPLSFGGGPHFCLGAPLARLEAHVVFDRLLSRFADITLAREPRRDDGFTFWGFRELSIRVTPP